MTRMDAVPARAPAAAAAAMALAEVRRAAWDHLAAQALEPNAFYDARYALPAYGTAPHLAPQALLAHAEGGRVLAGLLPVVSAWSALRLPVPALVAHQPYAPLTVPLLHQDHAVEAAGALIDAAAARGARLLSLPVMVLDGKAYDAFAEAMARRNLAGIVHNRHERAALDARQEAESYLRAGFGAKKLKELRRLRHRLDEEGIVTFALARGPAEAGPALERFLRLEAAGWKGAGGTGLGQKPGDADFARRAAAEGMFEIGELTLDGRPIASGLMMRQGERAFFFKIAYDEELARYSPGVQLTLELTRLYAADPDITLIDSTAAAGHPMIDHVWRERLSVGDLLIPTRPDDAVAAAITALMAARRGARSRLKALLHRDKPAKEKRI